MKYRVIFLSRVINQLAAIHLAAMERGWDTAAINAALAHIEAGLGRSPNECGESRTGNERVWVERPITAWFEVQEDEQVVVVLAVRYRAPRSG